jgi:hypothetical protein
VVVNLRGSPLREGSIVQVPENPVDHYYLKWSDTIQLRLLRNEIIAPEGKRRRVGPCRAESDIDCKIDASGRKTCRFTRSGMPVLPGFGRLGVLWCED